MEEIKIKKKHRMKENKDRFFYPEEWKKFYDKLKPKQKHTCWVLMNTGARINEVRNVTPSDIDFVNNRLVLRVTKTKAKKGETKGRIRTIPISWQFSKYMKKFCEGLQATEKIKILSTSATDKAIKIACEKAGIKDYLDFSAHNIRKTLETWLLALGAGDLALMAHFAHDLKTAARHYVSPDVFTYKEKQQMREIIGDLYGTH